MENDRVPMPNEPKRAKARHAVERRATGVRNDDELRCVEGRTRLMGSRAIPSRSAPERTSEGSEHEGSPPTPLRWR